MTTDQKKPYETLDPNLILEAIESLGIPCNGSLLALNSFENRVYQVGVDDASPLIAKFYRPHRWTDAAILEEHQFSRELENQEIPVIAPLILAGKSLHHYQEFRFALFPRKGGRTFEIGNSEQLELLGRFLGRIHAVGACQTFQQRIRLSPETHGNLPYQFLLQNHFIPDYLLNNYRRTMEILLEKIHECFQKVGKIYYLRLHGDFHPGNVLWSDNGPRIVDLDDALMGPAIQDIWMLLSGNANDVTHEIDTILNQYCEFFDFNYRELYLIEALRSLRMIHYAGWLAKRWDDPAFPMNFPWFNTPRYWQDQLQHLNEQIFILDDVLEKLF